MLGSNFSNFWQFGNFLAFQWAAFQHFTSTVGAGVRAGRMLFPLNFQEMFLKSTSVVLNNYKDKFTSLHLTFDSLEI